MESKCADAEQRNKAKIICPPQRGRHNYILCKFENIMQVFIGAYEWIGKLCPSLLWGCSTGADHVTNPMTLGSVAKVIGSWKKACENAESVIKSPTGRYSYRQDVMSIPTRRRVGYVFCTASRKTTITSPKPLTDKPEHKQTSRQDKQTSQEHVPDPSRQD